MGLEIDHPGRATNFPALTHLDAAAYLTDPDPWMTVMWWESPHNATLGIEAIQGSNYTVIQVKGVMREVPMTSIFPPADCDRERLSAEVSAYMRHAQEYRAAAASVSDVTRPTLLYYSALALAEGAALAYGRRPSSYHGLSHERGGRSMVVHKSGTFSSFYRLIRLDNLFDREPGPQFSVFELLRIIDRFGPLIPTPPGLGLFARGLAHEERAEDSTDAGRPVNMYRLPDAATYYAALYAFGSWARYHPLEWQETLSGRHSSDGYAIRVALSQLPDLFATEVARVLTAYASPPTNPVTAADLPEPLRKYIHEAL